MKKTMTCCLLFAILQTFTACRNSVPEDHVHVTPDMPRINGVSVWDRISTRSEPRRSSASTTLLSLGETFLYLDSTVIDSNYNNTAFLKVQLSDSTIAWAYGFASVLNATPGVVTKNVPLYMRPDLLTISDTELKAMDIVAVTEEWDDWIRIVGEKKANAGWIKKEFITYNTIDLAFALLAKRRMDEADPEQKIGNIEELLDNNPYPNTVFIAALQELLSSEKEMLREARQTRDREDDNRRRRND
jgi:hypothetical protein